MDFTTKITFEIAKTVLFLQNPKTNNKKKISLLKQRCSKNGPNVSSAIVLFNLDEAL